MFIIIRFPSFLLLAVILQLHRRSLCPGSFNRDRSGVGDVLPPRQELLQFLLRKRRIEGPMRKTIYPSVWQCAMDVTWRCCIGPSSAGRDSRCTWHCTVTAVSSWTQPIHPAHSRTVPCRSWRTCGDPRRASHDPKHALPRRTAHRTCAAHRYDGHKRRRCVPFVSLHCLCCVRTFP